MFSYRQKGVSSMFLVFIILAVVFVAGAYGLSRFQSRVADKSGDEAKKNKSVSNEAVSIEKTENVGTDAKPIDPNAEMKKKDDNLPAPSDGEATQSKDTDGKIVEPKKEQQLFTGKVIAGKRTLLLEFNGVDYEAALKSGKIVVLYFYANWCPICKAEVSTALYPAFNELDTDQVIGFQVNFNDNETDEDEKNVAREFGIAYQHTKVFLKNGSRVLKSPESWNKDRYASEIGLYLD